jgi:hypothetical protein
MKKRPALAALFAECSLFGSPLGSLTSAGFSTLPLLAARHSTQFDRLPHVNPASPVARFLRDSFIHHFSRNPIRRLLKKRDRSPADGELKFAAAS